MSSDELMALTDEEMINLAIENSLQLDHLGSKSDDALPSCWSQDEDANGNNQFVFNPDPLNLNVHYQPENEQPLCKISFCIYFIKNSTFFFLTDFKLLSRLYDFLKNFNYI